MKPQNNMKKWDVRALDSAIFVSHSREKIPVKLDYYYPIYSYQSTITLHWLLICIHPFLIFQKVGVVEWEKCNCILVTKMYPSESEMTRTTPECKSFDSDNSGTPKLWQSYGKIWWSDHGPVVREAIRFWERKYREYRKEAAKKQVS